jgi:hypothetical protein
MMISLFDYEYAGAKVIYFSGMCKEMGGVSQNLISSAALREAK